MREVSHTPGRAGSGCDFTAVETFGAALKMPPFPLRLLLREYQLTYKHFKESCKKKSFIKMVYCSWKVTNSNRQRGVWGDEIDEMLWSNRVSCAFDFNVTGSRSNHRKTFCSTARQFSQMENAD